MSTDPRALVNILGRKPIGLDAAIGRLTRAYLLLALRRCQGYRRDAARLLGISERAMHRLLHAHVTDAALRQMARRYGWPGRTERATEARRAAAAPPE